MNYNASCDFVYLLNNRLECFAARWQDPRYRTQTICCSWGDYNFHFHNEFTIISAILFQMEYQNCVFCKCLFVDSVPRSFSFKSWFYSRLRHRDSQDRRDRRRWWIHQKILFQQGSAGKQNLSQVRLATNSIPGQ